MSWLDELRNQYTGSRVRVITGDYNGAFIDNYQGPGKYWRTVLFHRLPPSLSNHHLQVDLLGEDGRPYRNPQNPPRLMFGWRDMSEQELERNKHWPAILDKPVDEPAGNVPIYANMYVWAYVARVEDGVVVGEMSDTIRDVNTSYIVPGYNLYHQSYYWLLQYGDWGVVPEPPVELPIERWMVEVNGVSVWVGSAEEIDIKVRRK